MNIPASRIDWVSWVAFRDHCDALIPWAKSDSETVMVKRFIANPVFTGQPSVEAFQKTMSYCPDCDWQDVGKIKFLVGTNRPIAHHFSYDLRSVKDSNIVDASFSVHPKPPRMKFSRLRAKYRDIDAEYYEEKRIRPIYRHDVKKIAGAWNDPGEYDLGVVSSSQAERMMESVMRQASDLPIMCQLDIHGDSFHVAKGDVVTVSNEITGWRESAANKFLVVEAGFRSPMTTPDHRFFTLQLFDEGYYSDSAHGPIQPRLVSALTPLLPGSLVGQIRANNAIDSTGRYRGRDKGVFDRSALTEAKLDDLLILGEGLQVDFRVYASIINTGIQNADSINVVRLTVLNKFGEVVYGPNEYSGNGVGKVGGGVYARKNADPREEANFKIEVKNAFGYAQPRYFTARPWSGFAGGVLDSVPFLINPDDCPSDLVATALSDRDIKLTWTPAKNAAGRQYAISIKIPELNYTAWTLVQSGLSDTTDNFLIVNTPSINTQPATAYDFVVWDMGTGREEFRSNIAWVKTLAQAVQVAIGTRSAPSNLTASATSPTSVILNWARNASDNDDVEVWRDGVLLTTLGGAVSTFTDTVAAASTHSYKVRNKWNAGTAFSLYSADASATTDAVPSGAANPTGLYAESNYDNTADVFWQNNGNLGAVTLKYRENGATVWQSQGIAAGQNTATLYGLNENTTYQLQIEIAGASEPSNIAFVYIRMIIVRGPYGENY
jgi:hypothetical protein